jgi:hypothetical protein
MSSGGSRGTNNSDDDETEDEGPEILADDATVDVEAERKETNTDEVLDRLERELVGLAPVKTRIKEIADLLVVDRLRRKLAWSPPGRRSTCPSPAARARGRRRSPCAWPNC